MSWQNYTQLWSLDTNQQHSQPSLRIALLDLRSEPEQPVQDASEQPLQRTDVVEAPEQPVEARVTCGDARFLHCSTHPLSDEADGLPMCPTCTREHVVVSHA